MTKSLYGTALPFSILSGMYVYNGLCVNVGSICTCMYGKAGYRIPISAPSKDIPPPALITGDHHEK